ncbi:hypothetical protein PVL29_002414 [Vitis rotundifolia]|uniref:Uncharacterized protein n=1 Tax=Vitis rotundifolia TaxID=103349 RepID=A0AA39AHN1_VITRO|nr:hypothetical protein PVL29_002414 [Vitis rotundifolia]
MIITEVCCSIHGDRRCCRSPPPLEFATSAIPEIIISHHHRHKRIIIFKGDQKYHCKVIVSREVEDEHTLLREEHSDVGDFDEVMKENLNNEAKFASGHEEHRACNAENSINCVRYQDAQSHDGLKEIDSREFPSIVALPLHFCRIIRALRRHKNISKIITTMLS